MANRAERRAQAKRQRRGQAEPQQGMTRSRSGLLDETSLQERSVRLNNKSRGEWKPSSSTLQAEDESFEEIPSADPKLSAASADVKAAKKERRLRERALKELARQEEEQEKEARAQAKHPAFARSPRWWVSLASWIIAGLAIIAEIVLAVLHAPAFSYAIPAAVFAIALIVLAVLARMEPTNYYEELARQDRMDDIRQAQQGSYRKPRAHTLSWWVRVLNWILIVAAAGAFLSLLFWTPNTWVIMGIAIAFGVGVLNLFIIARPSDENPHLDQYGTAI
ncbi:hypothetical protein [Alloscardovia criceti]|uniref:hypothetical protein n=1 Tax=Alloscardovia criceti TaxID=356828 RepID=UPI0003615EA3|nr:hypothetical protein [Alloscardovia criceti]